LECLLVYLYYYIPTFIRWYRSVWTPKQYFKHNAFSKRHRIITPSAIGGNGSYSLKPLIWKKMVKTDQQGGSLRCFNMWMFWKLEQERNFRRINWRYWIYLNESITENVLFHYLFIFNCLLRYIGSNTKYIINGEN